MTDYGEWIDSRGATLQALREHGGVWVLDCLPSDMPSGVKVWHALAKPRGTVHALIADWLADCHLPRTRIDRERFFIDAVRMSAALVLVVEDAHLLSGEVLSQLRRMTELDGSPTLVLIGDPAIIRVATASLPGFYQRASYVVKVNRLFE